MGPGREVSLPQPPPDPYRILCSRCQAQFANSWFITDFRHRPAARGHCRLPREPESGVPPPHNQRRIHLGDSDGSWPCLPAADGPGHQPPAGLEVRHRTGTAPLAVPWGSGPMGPPRQRHRTPTVVVPSRLGRGCPTRGGRGSRRPTTNHHSCSPERLDEPHVLRGNSRPRSQPAHPGNRSSGRKTGKPGSPRHRIISSQEQTLRMNRNYDLVFRVRRPSDGCRWEPPLDFGAWSHEIPVHGFLKAAGYQA